MEKYEIDDETICPFCLTQQNNVTHDDKMKVCSNCSGNFSFIKCFHCKKKIYLKNSKYSDGISINCPYVDCGKWFSKSSCGECERTLYFPDKYQEGSKVKCPFKGCEVEYCKINCPKCSLKQTFKISPRESYKEGLIITCKNPICKTKFQKINCFH